jgi:hypothetical protein
MDMDMPALLQTAYMLMGTDCRRWRIDDIPLVAQMVVDEEPSFRYDASSRRDAVLGIKCRLYDLYRMESLGGARRFAT